MRCLLLLVAVLSGCVVDNPNYSPLAQVIAERDGFDPFAPKPDMTLVFDPVDLAAPPDLLHPDMTRAPGTIGADCMRDEDCHAVEGAYEVGCRLDPGRPGRTSCCYRPTMKDPWFCYPRN